MFGLILPNKKDFFKVKIEIYHQIMRVITKYKSNYPILQQII